MQDEEFDSGFNWFLKENDIMFGSDSAAKLCSDIKKEIQNMLDALNSDVYGSAKRLGNLQGDMAEYYFTRMFNLKAKASGSLYRADVLRSTELGSVDVVIFKTDVHGNAIPGTATPYSLKYYKSGKGAASQQARSFGGEYRAALSRKMKRDPSITPESYKFDDFLKEHDLDNKGISEETLLYGDQVRLIPKAKMTSVKKGLADLIKKETNAERRQNLQKVYDLITDVMNSPDGKVGDIKLTRTKSEEIARAARKGKLDMDKLGLGFDDVLTNRIIWEKSLKTGYISACISLAIDLAPQLINIIQQLIEKGFINEGSFDLEGGLNDIASSFVIGTLTSAITSYASREALFSSITPEMISFVVMMCYTSIATTIKGYKNNLPGNIIASQLIQNGYVLTWACIGAVAVSKIPDAVFAKLGKGLGYLFGKVIGTIGNWAIPVVAQLLGTLIGSVIGGLSYKWLHGLSISLCVEKGYTFFGLVKQDYTIPEPLHKFLISDCINLKKEVISDSIPLDPIQFDPITEEPIGHGERILKLILERQVVGINQIAYIVR
jgi:hypothetical protein